MKGYMDQDREKRAARELRLTAAWGALTNHGTPPARPDYSKCRNAAEARWAALGGDPMAFRALTGDDERASVAALDAIFVSLGMNAPPKSAPTIALSREPDGDGGLDQETRDLFKRLGLDPDLARCRTASEAQRDR